MKEYEKPQRSQSKFNSLCSPKEFPLKDITEKIIACAIEVHSVDFLTTEFTEISGERREIFQILNSSSTVSGV